MESEARRREGIFTITLYATRLFLLRCSRMSCTVLYLIIHHIEDDDDDDDTMVTIILLTPPLSK